MTRALWLRWWWFVVAAVALWAVPRVRAADVLQTANFVIATKEGWHVRGTLTKPYSNDGATVFVNGSFAMNGVQPYWYVSAQYQRRVIGEDFWRNPDGTPRPEPPENEARFEPNGSGWPHFISGGGGMITGPFQTAPIFAPGELIRFRLNYKKPGMSGIGSTPWVEWRVQKKPDPKYGRFFFSCPWDWKTYMEDGGQMASDNQVMAVIWNLDAQGERKEMYYRPITVPNDLSQGPGRLIITYGADPVSDCPGGVEIAVVLHNLSRVSEGHIERLAGDEIYSLGKSQLKLTLAEAEAQPPEVYSGDDTTPIELSKSQMAGYGGAPVVTNGATVGDLPPSTTPAGTPATAGDIRESGQGIIDALKVVDGSVKGLGPKLDALAKAGGGTDMTATNAKVDAVKLAVDAVATKLEAQKTDAAAAKTAAETAATNATNQGKTQGSSAGNEARNILESKGGGAPLSMAAGPTGGDYAAALRVQFPAAFGGATIDCNPFAHSGLLTVAHWFRSACAWLALVTLGVFVWKDMGEWVRGFSTMRQAQGNTVAAGTGAQATALAAAGLITAAVVVCMTALVSWSFGDISFAAIRSLAVTSPMVGLPTAALGMLSEVLPVSTLVGCAVAKYSFRFYGASLFAACAAVVRFVVP